MLGNDEFTVITITDNTHLTLDRNGWAGIGTDMSFASVLRLPSIYSFFDNSDSIRGNIDHYGNLMIGNSKPSTMLEISGVTGNDYSIPEITITNSTQENTDQSRKTAINFRSYNAINPSNPYVTLGRIETSHYGSNTDNQSSMKFFINDNTGIGTPGINLLSITNSGIGFGGENNPLTLLHAATITRTEECSFLLQSSYVEDSGYTGTTANTSVFDERSNIYFGGGNSMYGVSGIVDNIKKNVLSSISGSKDVSGNSNPIGRLDFNTNNYNQDNENRYGLESRLSILNTGNVGIDIQKPVNIFHVGPEYRNYTSIKASIASTSPDGTLITLDTNLFTGQSLGFTIEQQNMFRGGSLIVENNNYTTCTIEYLNTDGGVTNQLTVNSNLSTLCWIKCC